MPVLDAWRTFLETPLTNLMVALAALLGGSFGLAIIVFTLITRALTFPLTVRSLRASRRLQDLQPRLKALEQQYREPRARAAAQQRLFAEQGINPIGCLGPQLIQLPILIAMNRVVRLSVGTTQGSLAALSGRLYPLPLLHRALPLNPHFLGIDLARPHNIALTGIVLALMLLQQRLSVAARTSSPDAASALTTYLTPGLFGFFVFAVPAGVGLYWAVSTLVGLMLQEAFVYRGERRWATVLPRPFAEPQPLAAAAAAQTPTLDEPAAAEPEPAAAAGRTARRRRRGRGRRGGRR